jgi:hypothetical protein
VSKRSKRRRDPRTAGNEGTRGAQRAGEGSRPRAGEGGGARAGEGSGARDGTGGSRGRPVETPRAGRGRSVAAPQDRARGASSWNLPLQIAFVIAVFAVVTLVAELAGAANLGVALGVGQVAFAIAVIYLLVRR